MSDFDRILVEYSPKENYAPMQYTARIWDEYWEVWYSEDFRRVTMHLEITRVRTIRAIRGML